MAKKQTKRTEVEEPQIEENIMVVEAPMPEPVKHNVTKPVQAPLPAWDIRDRVYYLKGKKKPLSYIAKSANVYFFDEDKGYERELKYCENQRTPFVDEMKGDQRLAHIIFRSGALFVPKEKTVLQKFLSLYHPQRDQVFYEYKPKEEAKSQLDWLEMEVEALVVAKNLEIDMIEAIMRVEVGSEVSEMSSKELKRDVLLYARNNPVLFLELVNDDNVILRNFGIKATEMGILKLSQDQRTFSWGTNDRKLFTVPFDEHPYSALASWFKTDEGMEIFSNIEKRLV